MYKAKAAIIGCGFMGPAHAEALARIGVQVKGILGVDGHETHRASQMLGVLGYNELRDLLKDDIDVVHITTPNRYHYEMSKAALLAGKHVLCEKPLAMTSGETSELVALAQQHQRVAGVNYNMRFYPVNIEAAQLIDHGDIGKPYSVVGSYVQDWLLYPTDYNWRVLADEGGLLRAVADIGTHWLDLIQTVTGLKVAAVFADLSTIHPVRKRPKGEVETFSGKTQKIEATEDISIITDDCGSILLRFDNGAVGNLWVSQTTAGRKNCLRYEIAGSKSALYWNSERPNELWCGHRDKANEVKLKDPGLLSSPALKYIGYPGGHNEGYPDTFKQCFKAFYDYVTDPRGTPEFPTFQEGHHEVQLCEAIMKSHQKKVWIEL